MISKNATSVLSSPLVELFYSQSSHLPFVRIAKFQEPLLTIDLRLPDGVGDAPESGDHEEDDFFIRVRHPDVHGRDQPDVDGGSEDEDRNP